MEWLRLLLLAPFSGVVGAVVFVVGLRLHIALVVYGLGLIRGAVPRKDNAINLFVLAGQWLLWCVIGGGGVLFLQDVLRLPSSEREAAAAAVIGLPFVVWGLVGIPRHIRSTWREAMIPGAGQSA